MQGLVVDAAERRRNPVRKLSRLGHPAAHQRLHEGVVLRTWQPFEFMLFPRLFGQCFEWLPRDRKSTRLNSSHVAISYAVVCLKKKTKRAGNNCYSPAPRPGEARGNVTTSG